MNPSKRILHRAREAARQKNIDSLFQRAELQIQPLGQRLLSLDFAGRGRNQQCRVCSENHGVKNYLNYAFRKWLLKDQSDPQIKDFAEELERSGGDADIKNISPYVTSKFNRFVMDTTLKRIVGQEKTAFNFEKIIMCEKRRYRSIFLRFLWLNKNTLKALSI